MIGATMLVLLAIIGFIGFSGVPDPPSRRARRYVADDDNWLGQIDDTWPKSDDPGPGSLLENHWNDRPPDEWNAATGFPIYGGLDTVGNAPGTDTSPLGWSSDSSCSSWDN